MHNRQIVLDTETTGLEVSAGHRVIEIGAIEVYNRRLTGKSLHYYLQPDRQVDPEAQAVHGISDEFLADNPRFSELAEPFMTFIRDAELVIHNAPFDVGFLNHELTQLRYGATLEQYCTITDTLVLARRLHPGQRNSLDALCRRYNVDNSRRDLHGALLDAEILARVYLAMTSGQLALGLDQASTSLDAMVRESGTADRAWMASQRPGLRVIEPAPNEQTRHQQFLDLLDAKSGTACLWRQLDGSRL